MKGQTSGKKNDHSQDDRNNAWKEISKLKGHSIGKKQRSNQRKTEKISEETHALMKDMVKEATVPF